MLKIAQLLSVTGYLLAKATKVIHGELPYMAMSDVCLSSTSYVNVMMSLTQIRLYCKIRRREKFKGCKYYSSKYYIYVYMNPVCLI